MRPAVICLGCVLIMSMSMALDAYMYADLARQGGAALEEDVLYRMFGEFRDYLSWMSFVNADIFFHGGMYTEECPMRHMLVGRSARLPTEELSEERDSGHEHAHDHGSGHQAACTRNILFAVGQAITLTEHRHLSGKDEQELLPWLSYAVKLNPYNIKAYAVGGYWVGIRLKRPDSGIRFLIGGLRYNPDSWEIYKTIGEIYGTVVKEYPLAVRYLEKARSLGNEQRIDPFEKRSIYVLLADAYAKTGDRRSALRLYQELVKDFPDNPVIAGQIDHLNALPEDR